MDITQINEALAKFIEGDVVNFADYAKKKQPTQNDMITSIVFDVCEGPLDDDRFPCGKELSYEEAQAIIFEQDYKFRNTGNDVYDFMGGYDKLHLTATVMHDGQEVKEHVRVDIGDGIKGKDGANPIDIRHKLSYKYDIANPDVEYKLSEYEAKYGTREENIDKFIQTHQVDLPKGTDYTKKTIADIAVGDIFMDVSVDNYYSKSVYTFFRVVKKTPKSVWLEQLDKEKIGVPTKVRDNGKLTVDMIKMVMPTDKVIEGKYTGFDLSKPFKLDTGYYEKSVCARQGRDSLIAWDGQAKAEA